MTGASIIVTLVINWQLQAGQLSSDAPTRALPGIGGGGPSMPAVGEGEDALERGS